MIKLFAPSYKRPKGVTTQAYLPECTYVVAESEAEEYLAEGHRLWAVPDTAQGNVCRIRNYILDHADAYQIVLLDDDLSHIARWENCKEQKLSNDQTMEFIENGFNLADEFDARLWGINVSYDKGTYREYTPFSLNSPVLGPFQACNRLNLRYDERLPLKEDYDLSLQVLNKYRKILRLNMYFYICKQHTNPGGCASYRTIQREQSQFNCLQKKWGSKIVRRDSGKSKTHRKKQQSYDINPIIKVPIGGV